MLPELMITKMEIKNQTARNRRLIYVLLVTLISAMSSSCASLVESQLVSREGIVTAEMVLNLSPLALGVELEDVASVDMLAINPEMIAFVDEYVDRTVNENTTLTQLVYAVIGEGRFVLAYDDSTLTAADTFSAQRGNCLSFTNLFIALARNLGLRANYQEVDIPADWSMSGQTVLYSTHVNVLVGIKNTQSRVVDFDTSGYDDLYDSWVISDQRARAHYFNNIGVEHMLAGGTVIAFTNFHESLRLDRTFSSSWINLGNLHRREGYPDYAEAAYLEALEYDQSNLMAMSNLANLYAAEGKTQLAKKYSEQVKSHRMNNPYYRYQLANAAFTEGDYQSAIRNLKFAIRERKEEDRFYFLMSLSYLMSGEKKKAERWMEKTKEVASQSENKEKYNHKLQLLKGMGTG